MTTPNEIEYERELIRRGRQKTIKELEEKERQEYYSQTTSGRWTMQQHFMPFAESLEEITRGAFEGIIKRTNISRCCRVIDALIDYLNPNGTFHISAITIKVIVDSYAHNKRMLPTVDMAARIGNAIESEIAFQYLQRQNDDELAALTRKHARREHSSLKYRVRATKHTARKKAKEKGIELLEPWSQELRNRVGLYLLEAFSIYGSLEKKNFKEGKKLKGYVFTDEFIGQIEFNERLLLERSVYNYPLIDIPKDWEVLDGPGKLNKTGGYYLEQIRQRKPLLRNAISNSEYGQKTVDMLNTLQHTAWRIDKRILDIASAMNDKRWSAGSFKVCAFDRPAKGGAPEEVLNDPNRLKQWKHERAKAHEAYTNETYRNMRTRLALSMAREYEHKTFFISYSCDWRGRFYAQQSWLHYASTDFERSLLKFRDGCKLDDDSLYWCKAELGAAYLGSSGSFAERIQWTTDNQELIRQIAESPLATVGQWEAAKDPWSFLQLCLEWNDVVIQKTEKFWKVPIGCDATCSAVQLLSAIRRDPVGMKHTNLIEQPTDTTKPEDAYRVTLIKAQEIAKEEGKQHLLQYLDQRKIGKQLMKAVYGGTFFGIRNGIDEVLKENATTVENKVLNDLTRTLIQAFRTAFPAAFEALDYLTDLAKAAHENGSDSLIWTTPTGDRIECVKHAIDTITIHTGYLGKVSHGNFNTEQPDKEKQVNAFAPSFVHSLDACVLKEAFSDWKYPLVTIHDCVKVLPKDMDRVYDRLRDAFVSITSGDLLAELADQFEVSDEQLNRLPQLSGDLSAVHKSRYFFN